MKKKDLPTVAENFSAYLHMVYPDLETMKADQRQQLKMAFYGGCWQMLCDFIKLGDYPEDMVGPTTDGWESELRTFNASVKNPRRN